MLKSLPAPIVSTPKGGYTSQTSPSQWVEVLVDCPDLEGLLTYRLPPHLSVQPGDILNVPLKSQTVGGIAIRLLKSKPNDLSDQQIRDVEAVVSESLFPPHYWELLEQTARYYCTPLLSVIRTALPPGLLGKSQLRIRLQPEAIPEGAENFCSPLGIRVLIQCPVSPSANQRGATGN